MPSSGCQSPTGSGRQLRRYTFRGAQNDYLRPVVCYHRGFVPV
ncbi:hypothetical protein P9622_gp11 [Escherichia phage ZCEC10]|nr:hypothetical protein P9622_gp11 [Escherichia phage ZCEC10]UJQ88001.1 hypothetical protein [Escherichia phage ZCEC10]